MILLHSEAQERASADPNRVVGYTTARLPPLELVAPPKLGEDERFDYPDVYRGGVMIDVIHDGAMIPREFLRDSKGEVILEELLLIESIGDFVEESGDCQIAFPRFELLFRKCESGARELDLNRRRLFI